MSSPKKRKKNEQDGDVQETKHPKNAKSGKGDYTEIDFKFEIRDQDTAFPALEKFISAAEKYSEDEGYDIVEHYVQSSEECAEIFKQLEDKRRKPAEILTIFSALECIIIRLSDSGSKMELIGNNIVLRILSSHMPVLYFSLNLNNKNQLIKKTLRLLTRMVAFSASSARAVQSQVDFNHVCLLPLCQRRDIKDSQDLRSCFIQFMMAFLLMGDDGVIRQTVEQKVILQKILQGIVFDKAENIQLLLATLLEKVVQNSSINKTSKVHLFSESVLKQFTQLYKWQGPKHWKDLKDKKHTKSGVVKASSVEEQSMVSELCHTFLTELCCSFKSGINFYDSSLGTSGKNQNHILTNLLSSLQNSSTHPLCAELIVGILQACPDQLHHFLSMMAPTLNPRATNNWMANMELLIKIYKSQPEQLGFLTSKSLSPNLSLVAMATVYLLPPEKVMSSFNWGLKQKSPVVRHQILEFLKLVMHRTVNILAWTRGIADLDPSRIEVKDLQVKLKEVVIKKLPDGPTLLSCWSKVTGGQIEKETEVVAAPLLDQIVRLEQVLCLYQELVPSLLSDNPHHISNLLESIRSVDTDTDVDMDVDEEDKDQMLPQLYLLKLLGGTDSRQLPWGKENASKHSLMYLLLELVTRVSHQDNQALYSLTLHLLVKLLQSTGLFRDQEQELVIWLEQLHRTSDVNVVEFCAHMMTIFVSNPYPYMDRVAEMIAETNVTMTDRDESHVGKDKHREKTIEEILAMDFGDNWDTITVSSSDSVTPAVKQLDNRQLFSPLAMVALELLATDDKYKTHDKVRQFVSASLTDILHTQTEPAVFSSMVAQLSTGMNTDTQIQYVCAWSTNSKILKGDKSEKTSSTPTRMLQSCWRKSAEVISMSDVKDSMDAEGANSIVLLVQQLLLYVRDNVEHKEEFKGSKKNLECYFTLLTHALEMLKNNANKGDNYFTDMEEEFATEFQMLSASSKSHKQIVSDVIRIIFQHPTLTSAFQSLSNSPSSDKLSTVNSMIINHIINILDTLKDFASCPLKETFDPYAESLLKAIQDLNSKKVKNEDNLTLVLNCFESLLPFVDCGLHQSFLKELLKLPPNVLVSKGKSKKLGKAGCLLMDMAEKYLNNVKVTKGSAPLPLKEVTTILNMMAVTDDKKLWEFCSSLLESHPAYALAVEKDLWEFLTENYGGRKEMIQIILSQNIVCRRYLERWLLENEKIVEDNLDQYAHLFVTYVRLAGWRRGEKGKSDVIQCLRILENLCLSDVSSLHKVSDDVICLVQSLVESGCIGLKLLKKMHDHLCTAMEEGDDIEPCVVELLVKITQQIQDSSREVEEETHCESYETMIVALMKLMMKYAKKKDENKKKMINSCLTYLNLELDKKLLPSSSEGIRSSWGDFLKACLRTCYNDPKLLSVIEKLAPVVYESENISPPIETLHDMLMSHSQFMEVMLGEKGQEVKGQLVSLLLCLVEFNPSCGHSDHLSILQGAYGASLSPTDQKLLRIMFLYEKNGKGMTDARAFLWGPRGVEHYALRKSLASSLLKHPSMEQIIEAFDVATMHKSCLHFPIATTLTPVATVTEQVPLPAEVYDPCFVLPLFCALMSSDCVVDCRKFVSSHCLGYTIVALSSQCAGMRKAAYTVLTRFLEHLSTVKFHERLQVTHLLDTLRNSMQEENERIHCLITVFLARVTRLLLRPDEHMYRPVNNFLLLKPTMDTTNVPEFYKLFNSNDIQHKTERSWMLDLLCEGLREMEDYRIMERRFTFKLLQSFYDSAMSDQYSQTRVLRVMKSACSVRAVAVHMAKNHGILTWISGAILRKTFDGERGELMTGIVHRLWFTMQGEGDELRCLPTQFVRETLLCCKRLITHVRQTEMSLSSLKTLTEVMSSALATTGDAQEEQSDAESVGIKEVLLLLYSCAQLQEDKDTAAQLKVVLRKLGTPIQTLKSSNVKKWIRKGASDTQDKMEEVDHEVISENSENKKMMEASGDLTEWESSKESEKADSKDTINEDIGHVVNNVMMICVKWRPSSASTAVHTMCESHQITLAEDITISTILITARWLLANIGRVDKINLKRKIFNWVLKIVNEGDILSKAIRRLIVDSSEFSFQFMSSLCSGYNNMLSHTEMKDSDLGENSLKDVLKVLNSIVLCLVKDAPEKARDRLTFLTTLKAVESMIEDDSLATQEKVSIVLRGWLLGSKEIAYLRHPEDLEVTQVQMTPSKRRSKQSEVSPAKKMKKKS